MLARIVVAVATLLSVACVMPSQALDADSECTDPGGCLSVPPGGGSGNEPDPPPSRPRPKP